MRTKGRSKQTWMTTKKNMLMWRWLLMEQSGRKGLM